MGKIKYWNLNKKVLLKNVMSLSMVVAFFSASTGCIFFCHEPEIPKALKEKFEKKREEIQ